MGWCFYLYLQKPKCIFADQRVKPVIIPPAGNKRNPGCFVYSWGGTTVICEYWRNILEGKWSSVSDRTAAVTRLLKTTAAGKRKWNPGPRLLTRFVFPLKFQNCGSPPRLFPVRLTHARSKSSCLTWSTYSPTEGFEDKGETERDRERDRKRETLPGLPIQFLSEISQWLPSNMHLEIHLEHQRTGTREMSSFLTSHLKQGLPSWEPPAEGRARPGRVPVGQLL